jgi:hypothetical protein
MEKTTTTLIEHSLDIFQQHPQATDVEIVYLLVSKQISPQDAWKLVSLVPLAFGRVLMDTSGASFSDKCIMETNGKKPQEKLLKNEPFFQEAVNIARSQGSHCREYWINIVVRSGEIKSINQALHAGSNIEDLVLAPPIIRLPVKI